VLAAVEGGDGSDGDAAAVVVEAEDVERGVFAPLAGGPAVAPGAAAAAVDGGPSVEAGTGHAGAFPDGDGGWEGLAAGALGFFEEAACVVQVGAEGGVGVGEYVGAGVVDAEGDEVPDGVAAAAVAGVGT
jgi:hypothetical protein